MKEQLTAFESGSEYYNRIIGEKRERLKTLSLEFNKLDYIQTLEEIEINTVKLRQLERRHNLKMIE